LVLVFNSISISNTNNTNNTNSISISISRDKALTRPPEPGALPAAQPGLLPGLQRRGPGRQWRRLPTHQLPRRDGGRVQRVHEGRPLPDQGGEPAQLRLNNLGPKLVQSWS